MTTTFQTAPKCESVKLIDFKKAEVRPGFVPNTYILIVSGVKPYLNLQVELVPLVYIQQPDYWGIEVVGSLPGGIGLPAEAEYTISLPLDGIRGKKGVEVIGAVNRQLLEVPPGKTV